MLFESNEISQIQVCYRPEISVLLSRRGEVNSNEIIETNNACNVIKILKDDVETAIKF